MSDAWQVCEALSATSIQPPSDRWQGADAFWHSTTGRGLQAVQTRASWLKAAKQMHADACKLCEQGEVALNARIEQVREQVVRGHGNRQCWLDALPVVGEVVRREMGLAPYVVQYAAAYAMLEKRSIELATGEGKTLVALMVAVLSGWQSGHVHVMTSNDYLAKRDAEWGTPVYKRCGLRCTYMTQEVRNRAEGYQQNDIIYSTPPQIAADLLRGKMQEQVLKSLKWAILDESDALLIDDVAVPLIISGEGKDMDRLRAIGDASQWVHQLQQGKHFELDRRFKQVRFTNAGREYITELNKGKVGLWQSQRVAEELLEQALQGLHFFEKDTQYLVVDEKQKEAWNAVSCIVLIDESTGRLMPDRTLRDGQHQALEAKEGLEITPLKQTEERISFQRFFHHYNALSAMTGTCWEVRHELWQVFDLLSLRIPPNKPKQRKRSSWRLYRKTDQRDKALLKWIQKIHATGQPILIGTRTVGHSETLGELLTQVELDHHILNATRHEEEAQIVAKAGEKGAITVATNMAGRGTDIKLGKGVEKLGGLMVMIAEPNQSSRVDRQLEGRSGRQGAPGMVHRFAAHEDEVLRRFGWFWLRWLSYLCPWLAGFFIWQAQWSGGQQSRRQRQQVLKSDIEHARSLGFAGES